MGSKIDDALAQVTQRPGSSRLAISVKTLTDGSQATVALPDFIGREAGARLRLSDTSGMRISTEVLARSLSRNDTVWVWIAGPAARTPRSVLAARLMEAIDASATLTWPATPC